MIITDKQKGLGRAIEDLVLAAKHIHCVRHLHANFRTTSHGSLALKQRLWAAAKATTVPWWEAEMEKIRDLSREAYKWLKDRSASHWSRSHFKTGDMCDMLLNNICECFNSAILEARNKPILMLERLRSYLMLRMARQKEIKWIQKVGSRIVKIMEKP